MKEGRKEELAVWHRPGPPWLLCSCDPDLSPSSPPPAPLIFLRSCTTSWLRLRGSTCERRRGGPCSNLRPWGVWGLNPPSLGEKLGSRKRKPHHYQSEGNGKFDRSERAARSEPSFTWRIKLSSPSQQHNCHARTN